MVTVLFADLVGYTSLAEHLDPENVKRLVESCFERLVADIETVRRARRQAARRRHRRPVRRPGRPRGRRRAGRAGGAADAGHAGPLRRRRPGADAPIRMRIGINTGEVLVGIARRLRLHGDGRRREHRLPPAVAGAARRRARRHRHRRAVPAVDPPRAVRHHPPARPRAGRAVLARHRRRRGRRPPGALRRPVRRAGSRARRCSTPPCSSCATATAGSCRSSARPASGSPASPTRSSCALEGEAIVVRTACAPYGDASVWAPVVTRHRRRCSGSTPTRPPDEVAAHRAGQGRASCGGSTPATRRCAATSTSSATCSATRRRSTGSTRPAPATPSLVTLTDMLRRHAQTRMTVLCVDNLQWADPSLRDQLGRRRALARRTCRSCSSPPNAPTATWRGRRPSSDRSCCRCRSVRSDVDEAAALVCGHLRASRRRADRAHGRRRSSTAAAATRCSSSSWPALAADVRPATSCPVRCGP